MKVKIGNIIYDSSKEPIMLIFADDKERIQVADQIKNMPNKEGFERKYCQSPIKMTKEEISEFMNENRDNVFYG